MINDLLIVANFILDAFLHIWPYLLVTIPLAVAVRMSGASKYISKFLRTQPIIAIILATAVGAFSPFCSCGVIPVITALLISGVPLAPVMSFWIASPSMDPEIFFLSVATIGWELAIWRLASTLILSMAAGFLTHLLEKKGWLGQQILSSKQTPSLQDIWMHVKDGWNYLKNKLNASRPLGFTIGGAALSHVPVCCIDTMIVRTYPESHITAEVNSAYTSDFCSHECGGKSIPTKGGGRAGTSTPFRNRLLKETWYATAMVIKFMILAFFLEALIELYIPSEWISGLLGYENPWAIFTAAILGIPAYTSNLASLPMISGLLAQGMNPAAGLAFLIAGPTTTLPAMAAVWGIVSRRVFVLYISFSLVGAILLGYAFTLLA